MVLRSNSEMHRFRSRQQSIPSAINMFKPSKKNIHQNNVSQSTIKTPEQRLLLLLLTFFSTWAFFHEHSQYSRGRGRLSIYFLSTPSTLFMDTQTLAGRLLQRAHLCAQLAARLEAGTFGFRAQVATTKLRTLLFCLLLTYFAFCSSINVAEFKQINVCWV